MQLRRRKTSIFSSHTQLCLSQVKPVCLALSLLHSFYNITPPPPHLYPLIFPPSALYWTGFLSGAWAPFVQKKKKKKTSRGGINKNVLAVTRDLSAGNEGPGGRRQRGENACSGVELDISVSCQRLVHGCGMLMSEVSLSIFFSLSLSLPPSSCPPPSLSRSRSLWEEEEKKRIDS